MCDAALSPVRFKYLLGELTVADWRVPMVQMLPPEDVNTDAWPSLDDIAQTALADAAAGYYCPHTRVKRFPLGLSRMGPWLCYVPKVERLYYVELAGTFEDYLRRRSAKSRHNLRRSVKKLLDSNPGGVLEIFTAPEEMPAFHRQAVEISKLTYQDRLLKVGLPDTAEYVNRMQALAEMGEARGYLLRDQGQPIAFAWCTARGRRVTYQVIGYRPECAASSPGTVLLYLILEDLFQNGRYSLLDFGIGEAFYKSAFATTHEDFCQAYLFRPRWRYRWRVLLHWWLDRLSSGIGRSLARMGVKEKVRRLMRGRYGRGLKDATL